MFFEHFLSILSGTLFSLSPSLAANDAGPPGPQRGTQGCSRCPCFGCWELALSCCELAPLPISGDSGGGGGGSDALDVGIGD